MKTLNYAIVLGAAMMAVSANAQYGALSKEDLEVKDGKQGVYGFFSPFTRLSSSGASASGITFALERAIDGDARVGGFFSDIDGVNFYQLHYRKNYSANLDLQLGLLSGSGYGNKTDFSLLAFTNIAKPNASKGQTITAELFGGLYRSELDKKAYFQFGARAGYPLQNGLSIDATYWNVASSPNLSQFSIGLGYRF